MVEGEGEKEGSLEEVARELLLKAMVDQLFLSKRILARNRTPHPED
jgi:hypothetical protein